MLAVPIHSSLHLMFVADKIQTGLTKQQIRSQIVDNRQNIRKQLLEMAKALQ